MEVRLTLQELAVMGFRAFLVMDNKVARQVMAENGGKWSKMAGNGRKKVHRGYLVENGVFACFTPFPYYYARQ